MYFESKRRREKSLPWFDARSDWEKSSDEYFENLDNLAQQLYDVDGELRYYSSLTPEDFNSGYGYVHSHFKELMKYVAQNESSDAETPVNIYDIRGSLQDIYNELSDLYDSAILYDNYCGSEPKNPEEVSNDLDDDEVDDIDDDDDWDDDGDDDDWDDDDFYDDGDDDGDDDNDDDDDW